MPVDTVVNLVSLLRQYRLLEPAQLEELTHSLALRFPDPRVLAKELIQRDWLTPYQINQLFQGRGAELVFDNFLLLERLGEGGMGQVFKARHRKLGQIVAVKIIRKDRKATADNIRRFKREIEAASKLVHPNVVHAIDAGDDGGVYFFVMEYVEGTDLSKLVKQQGPLVPAQAADYIRQAALGLQHAFEMGLVHRDIKPANLLLTKQGVIKVVDLGLARREPTDETTFSSTELTHEGSVVGTPDYIAPEQARNSSNADIRADIYSLGCTFYYLLTGQPPFHGGVLTEKLLKHQLDKPAPLSNFRTDVSPELAAVIEHLLAKRPEDRYQTPGELAAALANGMQPPARSSSGVRPSAGRRRSLADSGSRETPIARPVAATMQSDPKLIPTAAVVGPIAARETLVSQPATRVRVPKPRPTASRPRWLLVGAALAVVLFAMLAGIGARMLLTPARTDDENPANKDTAQERDRTDKDKKDRPAARPPEPWKVAELIVKRGGHVAPAIYDDDHPVTNVDLTNSPTWSDADMAALAGLPHLTVLHLGGTKITDKGVAHLESLTKLTGLRLNNTRVTDEGLAHLKGMMDLVELNLSYTDVHGNGLVHLQGAKKLRVLNLIFSKVDDTGLEAMEAFPQLEQLLLQLPPGSGQITNAGMVHLKGLTRLKVLSLGGSAVTDEGLAQLKNVGNHLTSLNLTGLKVSDAGLSRFKTLNHIVDFQADDSDVGDKGLPALRDAKRLQTVALNGTKIQDDGVALFSDKVELKSLSLAAPGVGNNGLKNLAGLPKLSSLALGPSVTDEGLVHLKGLKELQVLKLSNTRVQGRGLENLKGLTKLTLLDLSNTPIDDAGLAALGALTTLTTLHLDECRTFTDAGMVHLKGLKALKNLYLVHTALTDESLAVFKGMRTLETLSLSQASLITPQAVADLKKALPKTNIVYP